jgi:hypothetical protein
MFRIKKAWQQHFKKFKIKKYIFKKKKRLKVISGGIFCNDFFFNLTPTITEIIYTLRLPIILETTKQYLEVNNNKESRLHRTILPSLILH